MIKKEDLQKYGRVDQCEILDEMLHIKITADFINSVVNTNHLLVKVLDLSSDKYPILEKYNVDQNLFHLILKKH